jgi:hypothetical protein
LPKLFQQNRAWAVYGFYVRFYGWVWRGEGLRKTGGTCCTVHPFIKVEIADFEVDPII